MNTILTLLTLLVIKHFIADFILQFNYMVEQKGTYGADGGFHHAAIHSLFTLAILTPVVGATGVVLAVLDGVIHYHIDWAKMNITRNLTPKDNMFWTWLGIDQALHYLTYIGIVALIA